MDNSEENAEKKNFKFKEFFSLLKKTAIKWNNDNPWRLSAVVAYYALLSLPGLLVIIINGVGAIWGQEIVTGKLTGQISSALGPDAAESIQEMFESTLQGNKSVISTIIGIAVLIFGATGVFYHLQISINQVWHIKPNPDAGIKKFLIDRVLSFAFILVVGFLLLVSFILSAAISFFGDFIQNAFPDFMVYLAYALNFVISLGIITVLFALIFKYLPDAKVSWKAVWMGALITSVLFALGKWALSLYFGKADPGSAYGAAGSIILVLLWVSYSCLILFFGAEFCGVYAEEYGHKIVPAENAVRYEEKQITIEKGKKGD